MHMLELNRDRIEIVMAQRGILGYTGLAQKMGCTRQNLAVIVNRGCCRAETVGRIARALGVDPAQIVLEG